MGRGALLAGACVAPVVIQVVLFSSNLYATGTKIALALPFCLGVGMAIPWPIAGAGLAALPKPGMWMVRVKQAFGVFILATAAYYGYQSYELFSNRWVDASAVASSVQEKLKAGWHPSLAEGLAAARREKQAGADRHVGHVVQELPDDGQDDARERGRGDRAEGLREDQVICAGRSGRAARQRYSSGYRSLTARLRILKPKGQPGMRPACHWRRMHLQGRRQDTHVDTVRHDARLTVDVEFIGRHFDERTRHDGPRRSARDVGRLPCIARARNA